MNIWNQNLYYMPKRLQGAEEGITDYKVFSYAVLIKAGAAHEGHTRLFVIYEY